MFTTDSIPIAALTSLVIALVIVGIIILLPLYAFDFKKLTRSTIFVKALFWLPIFVVIAVILYSSTWLRVIELFILISLVGRELYARSRPPKHHVLLPYFMLSALTLLCFIPLLAVYPDNAKILITLGLATVLSDVCAYFFGSYLGNTKLPVILNNRKSWEGVLGQVVGALLGLLLVRTFLYSDISLWLFIPIGVGCAFGDLINSYVKRKNNIKDWASTIPGHGGFTDRLSSTTGSVLLLTVVAIFDKNIF